MVDTVLAVLLDQNHLSHEVSGLPCKALPPDHRNRVGAPEGRHELSIRKAALGALVVLADPLKLLFG
jgi:hypothetical protein